MLRPLAVAAAMPADLMARLAAAEATAAEAKANALAADGRAESARLEAVKAEATGQNARDMILRRDPKITEAEQVAAAAKATADSIDVKRGEYEAALLASVTDRASIHSQLNAVALQVAGSAASITALQAAVDRIAASIGKPDAIGARPVGLLALGGSTSVIVPLSRPMPNLNYRIEMAHSSVVTLAAGMLTETSRTTTAVTVKVTAVGVALVAGTLIVAAREG